MISVNCVLAGNSAIITEQNVPFREMVIHTKIRMSVITPACYHFMIKYRLQRARDFTYAPAVMKLSVTFFRVPLRHITVEESLMIILDAVTWRVEVKLAFRGIPLTLMREILSRPRFRILGGISVAKYEVG